jgi:nucleoside 2-deoxyribosyltransferase
VITSFDDRLEPAFQAIEAAAERNQLRAERLKDAQGDFRIIEMIERKINAARLIVADLTYQRQNVYFELGWARGRNKTVVTVAKEGTPIHFNAQDRNTIFYDDSRTLEEALSERFHYELTTGVTEPGL